ncbi:MAG: ribokinase [Phycisphaerales bacterium]|nr:MAG: ribokinase [Phycisphaerales bacterium]
MMTGTGPIADQRPHIVVVGSSNMDLVVKTARIPTLGETILGGDFLMVPGGKGANQAVAAAKLGAHVHFVARLGDDLFGRQSLANFEREGVDATHVTLSSGVASGVALITVDAQGNNVIVVAPGANSALSADDVERAADDIRAAGAVVAQLEVPLETVQHAAQLAHESGVPFILDPAPAQDLPAELLDMVSVLTPNETEARILTGVEVHDEPSARAAARKLLAAGVDAVVVTMGGQGFLLAEANSMEFIAALAVQAIDATAAGDAFAGGLAVGLAQGQSLREAATFAGRAAALSVMKMGAQPSMPTREEVETFAG